MKAIRPSSPVTIGVFPPSSPISATVPARYARGKKYLEKNGFRVTDGALCGKKDCYRSGSIRERAAEFNALLYRDDIQILMAAIGGNNTTSILPYIDYDYLKTHPKIVIGCSDVTALLLAIYAKTGLTTFYGPALADFDCCHTHPCSPCPLVVRWSWTPQKRWSHFWKLPLSEHKRAPAAPVPFYRSPRPYRWRRPGR